jgi:AraC-like DNA-binding protein
MITSGLNTFVVILIYGSLILLSFLTLVNPLKVNKRANYWFGAFLFLWSTFWSDEICLYTGCSEILNNLTVAVHFIQFFTPIVFYFSIIFYTNPNYRIRMADVKYLFLPALYLILLLIQRMKGVEEGKDLQLFLLGLILIQVVLYTIMSFLEIRKHQKKIQAFASNTVEIDLSWLEYIILSILVLSLVVTLYNIFFNALPLNVFINIFFLVIIFGVAWNSLKQKEIFPLDENQRKEIISIEESIEEEQSGEMKRKLISDSELVKYKSRLSELMDHQKPYLDSELNLIKLAELINATPHQLSYIINTGFNENFFQYINTYRVEKAKELLLKEEMDKLSILGIAFESGFNSKTSFNTTFKKIAGQSPSEFKKRSSAL